MDVKQSWKGWSFSEPEKQVVLKRVNPCPLPNLTLNLWVLNFFFLPPPISSHLAWQYHLLWWCSWVSETKKVEFLRLCVCTLWDFGCLWLRTELALGDKLFGATCCSLLPPWWNILTSLSRPSEDRISCMVVCYTPIALISHVSRRRQWQPTPVLSPGISHGWRSLVGCSPWGHEESDMTEWLDFHALEKEMATTLVFLPGESQGRGSLVDCRLWGRTESDTTEVT